MLDPIAIADSGPLISLARIYQIDLLPSLFSKILVPIEVWNEVTVNGHDLPGAKEICQAKWIVVQKTDPLLIKPLSILLDPGEAAAIAMAQTIPDSMVLLDDSRARKIAKRLNIRQIGTVGVLLRAKRMGLIQAIKPYLEDLVKKGIYLRQELVDAVLAEANEK